MDEYSAVIRGAGLWIGNGGKPSETAVFFLSWEQAAVAVSLYRAFHERGEHNAENIDILRKN